MKNFFLLSIVCFCYVGLYGQDWTETQKFIHSDRAESDNFGSKVSISGNYALVGAPFEDDDENGANPISAAGAAYIFQKDGMGVWHQIQKIVASDRASNDYFGNFISISGNYLIVGARLADYDAQGNNFLESAGAAYIFERNSSGLWVEVQKLVASDRGEDDFFGGSVSIEQNYAIVGAFNDEKDAAGMNPLNFAGSAYFFERNQNGVWEEVQKVVASDRSLFNWFGISVAISHDYAVIGASQNNYDTNGGNFVPQAGAAYIFERGVAGGWNQAQKITASDRGFTDAFGIAVAIDSNVAIVGAHQNDFNASGTDSLKDAGAVYIFTRDLVGDWQNIQKITASDRGFEDGFGGAIAIDKDWIAVGVLKEDEDTLGINTLNDAGSVYLFKRDSITMLWQETQKLISSQRHIDARFGNSVDVEDTLVMVGSQFDDLDVNGGGFLDRAGAVYVFQLPVDQDTTGSTSIFGNALQNNLQIYPNPAADKLTIKFGKDYQKVEIRIRNVIGQNLRQWTFRQIEEVSINLDLTSGGYILDVETASEKAVFKLIIAD